MLIFLTVAVILVRKSKLKSLKLDDSPLIKPKPYIYGSWSYICKHEITLVKPLDPNHLYSNL